jgi:hypothetical protein
MKGRKGVEHFLPKSGYHKGYVPLSLFEQKLRYYKHNIHSNNIRSEALLLKHCNEEELLTYRLRQIKGWPGPDPQPLTMFKLMQQTSYSSIRPSKRKIWIHDLFS